MDLIVRDDFSADREEIMSRIVEQVQLDPIIVVRLLAVFD